MKKLVFLLIGFSLSFGASFAQNNNRDFAPIGAQWWVNGATQYHYLISERSMFYAVVTGDTLIKNHSARRIHRENYKTFDFLQPFETRSVSRQDNSIYVFNKNDTVFAYNPIFNRFTPLYVFTANEGDTVCLPVFDTANIKSNPYAGGDTCFCFIIDSIRNVLYDTTYLQTFYEHSIIGDSLHWNDIPVGNWHESDADGANYPRFKLAGQYARIIGTSYIGFLPQKVRVMGEVFNAQKPTADSFRYHQKGLRCYKDANIGIHNPYYASTGCFFDTIGLGIKNVQPLNKKVKVYPNPAQKTLHLLAKQPFNQEAVLYLTDATGRLLKTIPIHKGTKETTIPVEPFPSGVYFLQLFSNHHLYSQKILIRKP